MRGKQIMEEVTKIDQKRIYENGDKENRMENKKSDLNMKPSFGDGEARAISGMEGEE